MVGKDVKLILILHTERLRKIILVTSFNLLVASSFSVQNNLLNIILYFVL